MQTKLTLRMDSALIERAKERAHEQGKSLSQMVAHYFIQLDAPAPQRPLPPRVSSLRGALKSSSGKQDTLSTDESDYYAHLVAKHQ